MPETKLINNATMKLLMQNCNEELERTNFDIHEETLQNLCHAKRKFIESYFINSQNNCLNDRDSVAFPHVYQNLFAPILRYSSAWEAS